MVLYSLQFKQKGPDYILSPQDFDNHIEDT